MRLACALAILIVAASAAAIAMPRHRRLARRAVRYSAGYRPQTREGLIFYRLMLEP